MAPTAPHWIECLCQRYLPRTGQPTHLAICGFRTVLSRSGVAATEGRAWRRSDQSFATIRSGSPCCQRDTPEPRVRPRSPARGAAGPPAARLAQARWPQHSSAPPRQPQRHRRDAGVQHTAAFEQETLPRRQATGGQPFRLGARPVIAF